MTSYTSSVVSSAAASSESSPEASRRSSMAELGFGEAGNRANGKLGLDAVDENELESALDDAWAAEGEMADMSVRILPGVRKLIDSLPEGKYAVATSGAKTYGLSFISSPSSFSHPLLADTCRCASLLL